MENQKRVIALGFFDGVHLGHGALLRRTAEEAKARGVRFGRPPRPLPENFPAVHRAWRSKKLTLKQAAKACEMPVGTFYSKAVQWETTAALPPGLDL